jgi:oxygen-independent coproporphyrinogen III oxidase
MQQLLKKYDTSGPRYTSYPPAPHFKAEYSSAQYADLLRHMSDPHAAESHQRQPISLYFHLPFCDTLCYFCGCTMLVSNDRNKIHQYIDYLKKEIDLVASKLGRSRFVVSQLHWGGGSPTHLTPEEIEELGVHIRTHFDFDPYAEISIEVDPRGFTPEHAQALQTVGFNRASVGVQDFSPDTQWAVNRIQSFELTQHVIWLLRKAGIDSINVDLIYGLPYQTIGTFRTTIDQVLQLKPDRLAVYNFAYVPWVKPHQKVIQIETIPEADKKVALHYTSIEKLTKAGYTYIGMDHYSTPEDELSKAQKIGSLQRNFQGYSTKAGMPMIGFGMSSIGKIITHDKRTVFIQNYKTLDKYYAALDHDLLPVERGYEMTSEDRLREKVISDVMCQLHLNVQQLNKRFEIDFEEHFASTLQTLSEMAEDKLVDLRYDENGKLKDIMITNMGKLFLRNIAMCFDEYLQKSNGQVAYSKTL